MHSDFTNMCYLLTCFLRQFRALLFAVGSQHMRHVRWCGFVQVKPSRRISTIVFSSSRTRRPVTWHASSCRTLKATRLVMLDLVKPSFADHTLDLLSDLCTDLPRSNLLLCAQTYLSDTNSDGLLPLHACTHLAYTADDPMIYAPSIFFP